MSTLSEHLASMGVPVVPPLGSNESEIVALLEVAVGNPKRSVVQQRAMLQIGARIHDELVPWMTIVEQTWTGKPCEVCGVALELGTPDRCDDCERAER